MFTPVSHIRGGFNEANNVQFKQIFDFYIPFITKY